MDKIEKLLVGWKSTGYIKDYEFTKKQNKFYSVIIHKNNNR